MNVRKNHPRCGALTSRRTRCQIRIPCPWHRPDVNKLVAEAEANLPSARERRRLRRLLEENAPAQGSAADAVLGVLLDGLTPSNPPQTRRGVFWDDWTTVNATGKAVR